MKNPTTWAGYRAHRKNPLTGGPVVTLEAEAQGLDTGERWATICDAHGTIMGDRTLALAAGSRRNPAAWCEPCRSLDEAGPGPQEMREGWAPAWRGKERELCPTCEAQLDWKWERTVYGAWSLVAERCPACGWTVDFDD